MFWITLLKLPSSKSFYVTQLNRTVHSCENSRSLPIIRNWNTKSIPILYPGNPVRLKSVPIFYVRKLSVTFRYYGKPRIASRISNNIQERILNEEINASSNKNYATELGKGAHDTSFILPMFIHNSKWNWMWRLIRFMAEQFHS